MNRPSTWPIAGIFRMFSSAPDAGRLRRPTDILLLGLSVLALLGFALAAPGPTSLDTSLTSVVQDTNDALGWLWEVSYALLAIWAVYLLLIPLAFRGRRSLVVDYLVAIAVALSMAVVLGLIAGTDLFTSLDALVTADPPPVYLAMRFAVATAVVVTASPHLTRPLRYLGRGILSVGAVSGIAIGVSSPIGIGAGFAVGLAAAAITHLLLGSPGGLLTAEQVASALDELGVNATSVVPAPVQAPGVGLMRARAPDGTELLVKVYGRDAWDGQLVGSLWTALTERGATVHLGAGRRTQVESEALAIMLAERAGVPVLPVIAVGQVAEGDALLVTRAPVQSVATLSPSAITDALVDEAWLALGKLHSAGIAHGAIDSERVVICTDGSVALIDFSAARLAPEHGLLMRDRVRLLVSLALIVGHDRAVASALRTLGQDALAEVLPYLQPAVLQRSSRRAVDDGEWSLADVRAATVAATGVESPPLVKIQRVSLRSVLMIALVAVVVCFLLAMLAGIDLAAVTQQLSDANLWVLLAALLMSPFIQVGFSFSTIGSTLTQLRYGPVLLLQYAIQFIALTLPATAARLALEVRFFQGFGIAAGAAISMGMIDSFSGFIVQIVLILVLLVSGLAGVSSDPSTTTTTTTTTTSSGSPGLSLLALVAGIVVLGIVVTLVVPRLRARLRAAIPKIIASLREQAVSARSTLAVLRHPGKVTTMILGNLAAQVLQAIVLGVCLASFGGTASLPQLILINTAVSLFAGLMPVPGGMGVAEAGYTYGLQAIGVPSAVAISTAIAFRMVTFYLPPIWGAFSMRWLRKHSYV